MVSDVGCSGSGLGRHEQAHFSSSLVPSAQEHHSPFVTPQSSTDYDSSIRLISNNVDHQSYWAVKFVIDADSLREPSQACD